MPAVGNLARRGNDRVGNLRREFAEGPVGLRRRQLLQASRTNEQIGEAFGADLEQATGPLGLGTPVMGSRNFDAAEAIGFGTRGF